MVQTFSRLHLSSAGQLGLPGGLPVASPSTAIPFPENRRQVDPSPREASGSRAGHAETPSLGQETGRGGTSMGSPGTVSGSRPRCLDQSKRVRWFFVGHRCPVRAEEGF